ncbi:hypothetical protein CPB84DRAFT_1761612 [Gymnopilus junonius]|uniref:Uncharacterized protein n=1 Tax=Gymnopilus junonius TaxID=109634 RepID=A0A9P5TTD7_GYMJU|nr:hypothetical protein CPB84DRAFT_1761612 [Gymnopilus junonius]
MTSLPFDIYSNIVQEFEVNDDDDREAIRTLSLSCRAFLPLCQKILFSRIDFRSKRKSTAHIAKFDTILNESPHLADYVLYLSYMMQYDSEDLWTNLSAMGRILSSLTHLRSFYLSWLSTQKLIFFDWSSLKDPRADDFCDAIEKVLRSDHLMHLRIPDMKNFPFFSFTDRAALLDITEDGPSSIKLGIAVPAATNAIGRRSPQSSVKVQTYSVGTRSWPRRMIEIKVGGQTCLRSPSSSIPPLDFSSTRFAIISVHEHIHSVEAEKVLRCAHSLEQLSYEVRSSKYLQGFGQALLSGCASTLTVLHLTTTIEADEDPLEGVKEELHVLAGHMNFGSIITRTRYPQLKYLNLHFLVTKLSSPLIGTAGEEGEEELEERSGLTLEDIDKQHLSYLKTVMSIEGLEVEYLSAIRMVYVSR